MHKIGLPLVALCFCILLAGCSSNQPAPLNDDSTTEATTTTTTITTSSNKIPIKIKKPVSVILLLLVFLSADAAHPAAPLPA